MPSYYRVGGEFAVNRLLPAHQMEPAVAGFADGGFVVAWSTGDATQDGSGNAIKAQLFDAGGTIAGPEFLVNSAAEGNQFQASAAVLGNGNFVIAWATQIADGGSGEGIKAQLFSRSGIPIGSEFMVGMPGPYTPFRPNIAPLANGGFVISWDAFDMKAQMFDAAGGRIGGVLTLNTDTVNIQGFGDIVALAGGGFVATWRTNDPAADGSEWAVKAQLFDASGGRVGEEFLVNGKTAGFQNSPDAAALADGGFVLVWSDTGPEAGNSSIRAQIYGASGNPVGAEFLVNSAGAYSMGHAVVTTLPDGGFMVAWDVLFLVGSGYQQDIKAQVFSAAGAKVGDELLVNSLATGIQWLPDIAGLADGRVVVAWTSAIGGANGREVRAQIFGPNAAPEIVSAAGDAIPVTIAENGTEVTTIAATDAGGPGPVRYAIAGGADAAFFLIDPDTGVLSFADNPDFEAPADAGANNVYELVVSASDGELSDIKAVEVTVANVREGNVIVGTSAGNTIAMTKTVPGQPYATRFEDTISGLGGADTLMGGGAADIINGGAGNDVIFGNAGADVLTGGTGGDRFTLKVAGDSPVGASDLIRDFSRSQGDRIGLADIDARTNAGGNQSFTFIGRAAFSGDAGQLRFEQVGGDTFVSGDVNGDAIADFQIQLQGLVALAPSDFIL